MSPYKEVHFFNRWQGQLNNLFALRLWWKRRSIHLAKYGAANHVRSEEQSRALHSLFLRSALGSEGAYRKFIGYFDDRVKIAGEITPTYTDLGAREFAEMDRVLPGARFIVLLRNPVDRFLSQRNMDSAKGSKRVEMDVTALAMNPRYVRRSDYRRTLTELFSVIPRDRVHIEFYDRLFSPTGHESALRAICEFMGIENRPGDVGYVSNPGKADLPCDDADRLRLAHLYAPTFEYVDGLFDGDLPDSWRHDLERLGS